LSRLRFCPISIASTTIYIVIAAVLTGIAPFRELGVADPIAGIDPRRVRADRGRDLCRLWFPARPQRRCRCGDRAERLMRTRSLLTWINCACCQSRYCAAIWR
jgi:hypothetical protein